MSMSNDEQIISALIDNSAKKLIKDNGKYDFNLYAVTFYTLLTCTDRLLDSLPNSLIN